MSHTENNHPEKIRQDLETCIQDLDGVIKELSGQVKIPLLYKLALEEGIRRLMEHAKCA